MALITRTSIGTGRVPPTRITSRSSSTRSRRVCRASGISPISSRNRVPPLAASNRPAWPPRRAPVNAPSSWPNSSDSSSDSAIAPQLTATNGRFASWLRGFRGESPAPPVPCRCRSRPRSARCRASAHTAPRSGAAAPSRASRRAGRSGRAAGGACRPVHCGCGDGCGSTSSRVRRASSSASSNAWRIDAAEYRNTAVRPASSARSVTEPAPTMTATPSALSSSIGGARVFLRDVAALDQVQAEAGRELGQLRQLGAVADDADGAGRVAGELARARERLHHVEAAGAGRHHRYRHPALEPGRVRAGRDHDIAMLARQTLTDMCGGLVEPDVAGARSTPGDRTRR